MITNVISGLIIGCYFISTTTENISKYNSIDKDSFNDDEIMDENILYRDSRIMNGYLASIGSFGYQVGLFRYNLDKPFFCGGAILSAKHVITAAHCIYLEGGQMYTPYDIYVKAGDDDYNDHFSLVFQIQQLYYHPYFYPSLMAFDVGIIKIVFSFPTYVDTYQPIPLASSSVKVGTKCTVSGWGKHAPDEYAKPGQLYYTFLYKVDNHICSSEFSIPITDSMTCFEYKNRPTAPSTGDSGGPLVCGGELGGIVSFAGSLSIASKFVVFANVPYLRSWIEYMMRIL